MHSSHVMCQACLEQAPIVVTAGQHGALAPSCDVHLQIGSEISTYALGASSTLYRKLIFVTLTCDPLA